ncbi:MAG: Uncharacterised protein [Rhodospirillaceae bacterium]|jgi:hypothetical protein|nr:MAG: Uncharacterised protein [Rhodospirillaceae bacterium]
MLQMLKSRRLFIFLGLTGLFIVAGIVAVLMIMTPLTGEGDVVYLQGDDTPYKVRPSEEGGQKIAHQDSRFMAFLDKGEDAGEEVEIVNLNDDLPEPPPIQLEEEKEADASAAVDLTKLSPKTDAPAKPIETETVLATPLIDANEINTDADSGAAETGQSTDSGIIAAPIPTPKPENPTPKQPAKEKKPINPDTPIRQIQLAAFQSQNRADTAAALLSEKHKTRLKGYVLSANLITKADGGQFWRVMTGQIPATEAAAICDALKKAGQDCILRKANKQQ